MQNVVPAVRVSSYKASKVFYESLGFYEQWTHQFESGLPIFASVARKGMEIFLTEHTGDCAFGALIHFYVPNVDSLYDELNKQNVVVLEAPNNQLGADMRCMDVVDPDNNRLKFITLK